MQAAVANDAAHVHHAGDDAGKLPGNIGRDRPVAALRNIEDSRRADQDRRRRDRATGARAQYREKYRDTAIGYNFSTHFRARSFAMALSAALQIYFRGRTLVLLCYKVDSSCSI